MAGNGTVQWAAKVPQWQIRRLYETDAQGIIDDELIDKVGGACGRAATAF